MGAMMPPSRLVPSIRYGGSGYAAVNPATGTSAQVTMAFHADHFIDPPLAIRISYWRNQEIRVFSLLDTRPTPKAFDDVECIQDGRGDFVEW